MHLFLPFLVCLGLFLLFPKSFKFMVGSWVGFTAGGFAWSLATLAFSDVLFTPKVFVAFAVTGIIGGCIIAAKG